MPEGSTGRAGPTRLPERTAAIAARRAGVALREAPADAARLLLELALDVVVTVGGQDADGLLEHFADEVDRLRRTRRRALWRELRSDLEPWGRAA